MDTGRFFERREMAAVYIFGMRMNRSFPSLFLGLALVGAVAVSAQPLTPPAQASAGQEMKNAGKDTSKAAKDVAKDTAKETKKAYHAANKDTKKAYHATNKDTKKAYKATEKGTKKAYHKTKDTTVGR